MSADLPLVSVIIATRNRAHRLKHVIDAILEDPYPHVEVVVADGLSKDGTPDLLRSYGSRVKWVSEADGGEFYARNRAIGLASGEFIRNCSDDDVPVPGGIGAAVRYFAEHPDVDLLFGQTVNYFVAIDGTTTIYDRRPRTSRSCELRNFVFGYAPLMVSESVFFRRSMIEKTGGFRQMRPGDVDHWMRALLAGSRAAVHDHVFVHHFRFEEGERALYKAYRGLLQSAVQLTDMHLTLRDRIYVRVWWLPTRLLRHDIAHLLSPRLAGAIRRSLWRWRGRHVEQSTWIPPVRQLTQ